MTSTIPTSLPAPRRNKVREEVLDLIFDGKLSAGERIVESQLAEQLKVSRTPLREALFVLEREGFVRSDLARGFSLLPLTSREVREIYPMIWTLESLAIRSSGDAIFEIVSTLRTRNKTFKTANKPTDNLKADLAFHAALISTCPNQRLNQTIQSLKEVAHRYECFYMQDKGRIENSVEEHAQLIELLSQHDLTKVLALLEKHWLRTMNLLIEWLDWRS
jgi:DNA-binding GntR family transcriptional regulator